MRVGIVGSRRRLDKDNVIKLVQSLSNDDIIITGGCRGVDKWAEEEARRLSFRVIVYKPDLENFQDRYQLIQRYYDRNQLIAENCDVLHAFVAPDRKGGTENTINHAKRWGKQVILH
jgi:hypothetical protein